MPRSAAALKMAKPRHDAGEPDPIAAIGIGDGEALRLSEERFRLLVESGRDYAIYMLDSGGHVISWNRGAELINGYGAKEILGQHFGRFYPPEDALAGKPAWELEQARQHGTYEEEGWRIRKDGSRFWSSVLITALTNSRGAVIGFAKVTRDLTERRETEQKLLEEQRSRARADALARRALLLSELSQALVGTLNTTEMLTRLSYVITRHIGDYCIVDLRTPEGTLQRLAVAHADPSKQPLVAEMRQRYPAELQPGYPTLEVLRTGKSNLVHAIGDEMLLASARDADHLELLRALGPTSHMIVALPAKDHIIGTLSIVSSQPERLYDATDVALAEDLAARAGLAISNAELLERERQSRAAAETLARAGAVLSSSLDVKETLQSLADVVCPSLADWCVIAMLEPDGQLENVAVAHVDPAKVEWARLWAKQYPNERDARTGPPNVVRTGKPELYSDISDEMLAEAARDEQHLRLLRELGLKDVICVPITVHGRILGALTLISAESGRSYGERDVELASELASRAGIAAENAVLYAAAQAAIQLRDEFIGIASHELKTPLAALQLHVQSMLRIAKKEGSTERNLAKLQSAMEQIERQSRMISQLLDFSRLASGRVELVLEPLDLADLIDEITRRFGVEAERNRVRIKAELPETLVGRWDRNTVDQIITNLLSNAIKYGRGKPVEISARQRGDDAVIVIRDHGIGIAPEDHARVFGRFERAVSSRNYSGFGLGLWIARRGVEGMGGRILLESEPGQGSAFTVELPISGASVRSV